MAVHVLGIRHHGPGSAKNVHRFLKELRPDIVLVEGPPDADAMLQWSGHAEIKPPVAILVYQPERPQESVFYPFAEFSPEWQAIQYAQKNNICLRFMDLPCSHRFAAEQGIKARETEDAGPVDNIADTHGQPAPENVHADPVTYLAAAAGYDDTERWWEHTFEYRDHNEQVFDAVAEAMVELRTHFNKNDDPIEKLREAWMRKIIRQAEKEMFTTIAVICGAWHVPALMHMPKQKEDNELLKGLQKVRTECTWVPWIYSRLSMYSGYGAGIASPGWFEHVWKYPQDDGTRWMTKVARVLRKKDIDISVAHVIEAVRLAEALTSMRGMSKAGLQEMNEAALTVLCHAEPILMGLIETEIIISNKIGEVPADIPKAPLQIDIEKQQKRLRLPPAADFKDYILDLRKDTDRERSIFLHRLQLLGLKWGSKYDISGKGTFKEQWRLQWDPAFSIDIIEKGKWGNSAEEAVSKFVIEKTAQATSLTEVSELLDQSIPAELTDVIQVLIARINSLAVNGDVVQLIEVIPNLVNVSRYGNVRKTDATLVSAIIESFVVRICISLPAACTNVQEEAAGYLLDLFFKLNDAINILQHAELTAQ